MDKQKFEQLKNLIIVAARRTFTCKNGYRDLVETKSWGEIIMWFDKYWSDVLLLSKNDGFRFWTEVYPMYKEEFNRCGIWFNENADSGKAIVTEGAHTFRGNATVWAYNQSKVELHDNVRCTANNQSFVDCYDYTQVMLLDQSECHAYVRSKVNAGGESVVDAYDACTITAGDRSTVIAHSWNQITAVGEAKVLAPSKFKIKILGQAKLTLKKPEEL